MLVWSTIEASCPLCAARLRLRELGGGFVAGQDSDLLVRMPGKHLIQAAIHSCPKCRFSGYAADFVRSLSPETRRRFLDEIATTLRIPAAGEPSREGRTQTPLPDVQYYWAYRSAQALGLSDLEQGERLLRAYWCCRLPPSSSLAPEVLGPLRKAYLRGAIQKLRESQAETRDPSWTYLLGELCRRNGNFQLASGYLRQFLALEEGARYLRQAAAKLLDLVRRREDAELTMEELLYDRAPDPHGPSGRSE